MQEGETKGAAPTRATARIEVTSSAIVIVVAALAWFAVFTLTNDMTNSQMSVGMTNSAPTILTLTSMFASFRLATVSSFVLVWVVGMIAMMFPAMVPIVTTYSRLVTKSEEKPAVALYVGTPLFLGGYVAVYALLGVVVFLAIFAAFYSSSFLPLLSGYALPAAVAVLFGAGLWQLTPLKDRCLSQCVSPLGFFMAHMKAGLRGAFGMGVQHGKYCVGCCYVYMLVMVAVSAMSIFSMLLLTALILVEKAIVRGALWFRFLSAAIFFSLGGALILSPQLFGLV